MATPIYHVVFHMFVLVAACIHWFMVYYYILPMDITSCATPIEGIE